MRLINASLSQRLTRISSSRTAPAQPAISPLASVARAEPDGYTLFIGTVGPIVNNKFMYKNLDFDPDRAFAPIALLASSPLIIVGSPKLPVKNLNELIAYAKAHARPAQCRNGRRRVAGTHLRLRAISTRPAGIAIGQVPYRITSQALPDLASGDLQLSVQYVPTFVPQRAVGDAHGPRR